MRLPGLRTRGRGTRGRLCRRRNAASTGFPRPAGAWARPRTTRAPAGWAGARGLMVMCYGATVARAPYDLRPRLRDGLAGGGGDGRDVLALDARGRLLDRRGLGQVLDPQVQMRVERRP